MATVRSAGVSAETPAGSGGKEGVVGTAGSFGQPGRENLPGRARQGHRPLFSPLAFATDVSAGAENDVCAVETDEFGDPQAGLQDKDE
jgi:hypothetical protein